MARRYTGRGGPIDRRLRYPVAKTVKLSQDAVDTLEEMAERVGEGYTPMTLMRRAIMKDIYIYKNEKKNREQIAQELGPDE
jgi:hypothetical protein